LINNASLELKYSSGRYSIYGLFTSYLNRFFVLLSVRKYHLLFIEKEAFPWFPTSFELFMFGGVSYILDYDDAIFHNYDQTRNLILRFFFKNPALLTSLNIKSVILLSEKSF
jgi:hypothetical protein